MYKIFSPIKQRLFQFIDQIGITKETFFETTGISASNFKGIGAKSELGGDKIIKILSQYPSLSAEWLLLGLGEMIKSKETPVKFDDATLNSITVLEKKLINVELSLKQMEYTQKSMQEQQISILNLLRLLSPTSGELQARQAANNKNNTSVGSKEEKASHRKREQNS